MATSEWLRFFEDAGIPPGPALGYAVAFVDNRIHKNMLLDLTRELMKELGITAVGDVIAILRHAKVVHRQEMCRAASESLQPEAERGPGGSWRDREDRDQRDREERDPRDRRDPRDPRDRACAAAGRMISHSLRREPRQPRGTPGTGICVTVPNGANGSPSLPAAPGALAVPGRRRRVTAEMEGKYRISLPKGSTARSRKILQLQAASGLGRPSVFQRLGAEHKATAAPTGKPSGVFSRLGEAPAGPDPVVDPGGDPLDPGADPAGDAEALPYAGVLKRRRERAAGGAAEPQDGAVSSSASASASGSASSSVSSSGFGSGSGSRSGSSSGFCSGSSSGSRSGFGSGSGSSSGFCSGSGSGFCSGSGSRSGSSSGFCSGSGSGSRSGFGSGSSSGSGSGFGSGFGSGSGSGSPRPGRVSSSCGSLSVFRRLGRKPD